MSGRVQIPMSDGHTIFISPADDAECEVHDWPTEGFGLRLVDAMRAAHPKGINSCVACVARAKESLATPGGG